MHGPGNQIEFPLNLPSDYHGYVSVPPPYNITSSIPMNLQDNPLDSNNLAILNPEIFIVAFLLLALPICIYLAYRYGKKTGRKEHVPLSHKYFGPGAMRRRSSIDSTSGNSYIRQISNNSKDSSTSSSPNLNCTLSPPESLKKDSPLSMPMSIGKNKRESSVQTEDEKIDELVLNDKVDVKTDANGQIVFMGDKVDSLDNIDNFKIAYTRSCGAEDKENELDADLFQEKLLLHSQDDHVLKKEVQYDIIFKREGRFFQKREVKELTTTYCEGVDGPEHNAKLLKKTYQIKPHNGVVGQKLFGNAQKPVDGTYRQNKLLAIRAEEEHAHHDRPSSLAPERAVRKNSEAEPKRSSSFNEIKCEEKAHSSNGTKIENVVEKYGVPDETGKFNKIFKDVEWIGEGSFGEVYKVVHRLDGKHYAVKKVKLRLGRFEELKKESKVFREVFAMTDLHHPNIVRYSTCWVELEWDKENKEKEEQAVNLGDISENEMHEEDASDDESDLAERSKTSDLGFDWGESSKSSLEKTKKKEIKKDIKKEKFMKKPTEKRAPRIRGRKSCLSIKTLSKSFIEEELDENSKNSSVSKVESICEVPGCKLYLYIQMEYCAGQSLKYFLENPKRKVVREKVLGMFKRLLEGVNAIHSRGILHRDLKPANIFLDGNENVKIGDFGLASLDKFEESSEGLTPQQIVHRKGSLHSSKVGTPMYTSPEQESGGNYDQKTDVYSLGLIFYEMLVNFVTNHERYEHFSKIRFEHELPTVFKKNFAAEGELILQMTKKSPEDRPTAEQLIADVNKLLDKYKSQSN